MNDDVKLNWNAIQDGLDKNTLTPEEIEFKKINEAYRRVLAAMQVQAQLQTELAKVAKEAAEAVDNLNAAVTESMKNFPSPQQQLYREALGFFGQLAEEQEKSLLTKQEVREKFLKGETNESQHGNEAG